MRPKNTIETTRLYLSEEGAPDDTTTATFENRIAEKMKAWRAGTDPYDTLGPAPGQVHIEATRTVGDRGADGFNAHVHVSTAPDDFDTDDIHDWASVAAREIATEAL